MAADLSGPRHHSIDLQIAVLRSLPTPVVVLSPQRTAVYANRAAETILGRTVSAKSTDHGIVGLSPGELGVRLLYNRNWTITLDRVAGVQKEHKSSTGATIKNGGLEDYIQGEADIVIRNPKLAFDEKHFRVSISALTADDGLHYILSFARHSYMGAKPAEAGPASTGQQQRQHDINMLKRAVFNSYDRIGFILTADEQLYLTNAKAREVLGDVMGGPTGLGGSLLRRRLEIWNEDFTRRLEADEYPGMKIIKSRTPYSNYRCGFLHAITGERIVMRVNAECLYDDDTGEFLGGVCWCDELQEYTEAMLEARHKILESHETICDVMPHMVWTTRVDGYCDYVSQRWYEFTGRTKDESLGNEYLKAVHPEDQQVVLAMWGHSKEDACDCEVEVRYERHDGVFRWVCIKASPFRDEDGEVLKWYGTITDIHDLVMARIKARRKQQQVMTVLAHAEVNLFSIDTDRKITLAEGGMFWDSDVDVSVKTTMVGQDAIALAKQTQPGGVPGYESMVLDILAGKLDVASGEDTIGNRTYRTRVVAELEHNAVDGGEKPAIKGCLGLSIDVTDMKARAALEIDNTRLLVQEQAAKDSNRLKSVFLANMSHEMRTPTAGVIGMLDLLSDDTTLSAEQREYIDSIQLSAKALLSIVNDILDFSKIESGRMDLDVTPFELSTMIREMCKMYAIFADQKTIHLEYNSTLDESLEVLGDSGRLRQILSNLLTNALKFTNEGSVSISVSGTRLDRSTDGEALNVTFVIEDTGIGIKSHILDTLFRPFHQGDPSTARLYGGTGLGLAISRQLASLMGGTISLESVLGIGSKATVTIPMTVVSTRSLVVPAHGSSPPNPGFRCYTPFASHPSPLRRSSVIDHKLLNQQISNSRTIHSLPPLQYTRSRSADEVSFSPLSPAQRSRTHVLVVEDNAINQTIALKTIRKLGFPVTAVWNGREALSYLLAPSLKRPRPSIILMDVQMPIMDGYEATTILRTGSEYDDEPSTENDTLQETSSAKKGKLRDIPVIAMTASAITGDKEKCLSAGMDDFLVKPVQRSKLEAKLVEWARKTSTKQRCER